MRAGHAVTITWVYLGPSRAWEAALPDDVRAALRPDFPHYATSKLGLDVAEVNLLAYYAAWVVTSNAAHFAGLGEAE